MFWLMCAQKTSPLKTVMIAPTQGEHPVVPNLWPSGSG